MKNIQVEKKVSEYNVNNKDLIKQLYYQNHNLVDCEINIIDEDIEISYNIENLEDGIKILEEEFLEKLKFLINCSDLEKLKLNYLINLDLQNIYYNFNYQVKLLDRNFLNNDFEIIHQDFIKKYKCLIGQVMNPKYSYKDYYEGGMDLLKNNKLTKEIFELDNLYDIVQKLIVAYNIEKKYIKNNKAIVNKKNYKINKYTAIISSVGLICLLIYSGFATFKVMPTNNNYLKASNNFISKKYDQVVQNLSKVSYEKIPKETKYILAVSYIYSEPFSSEQKNIIFSNVTPQSDVKIYDYWVTLGRLQYEKSIDIAKQLGDNEYLVYAYLKQLNEVKNNTQIDGEQKQKQINEINSAIEKAVEQLNKKNNDNKSILE